MANTVEKTLLLGGSRIVFSVYLKSDGAEGELSNYVLISPSELDLPPTTRFRLECIAYNFAGFDALLAFDTGLITKKPKWVLAEGSNTPVEFDPFGGLRDPSGLDGTGNLLISTTGFTASQDQGSLLVKLKVSP